MPHNAYIMRDQVSRFGHQPYVTKKKAIKFLHWKPCLRSILEILAFIAAVIAYTVALSLLP